MPNAATQAILDRIARIKETVTTVVAAVRGASVDGSAVGAALDDLDASITAEAPDAPPAEPGETVIG